jgi:DNA-binding GntR family transcriptional regulator
MITEPVSAKEIGRMLDKFSRPGLPKYTALRDAVVHAVASGKFAPGDRLPNEQELAEALPISLGTIQRGLRQLVDEGVLQRRHGQGSFIAGRTTNDEMSHPCHCRVIDDSGANYLKVYPKTTGRKQLSDKGLWSAALSAAKGVEITRVISIGKEFSVYSSFVVDALRLPIFSELSLRELDGENFKDLIFRASGQLIKRVDLFLRQAEAPKDALKALGLSEGAQCLCLKAIAYLTEGDAVYYQNIYIPPTNRELHVIADARASGFE